MLGSFIKHLVPKWNIEYTIKTKGLGHLHLLEVEIEERIEWSILFIFFYFFNVKTFIQDIIHGSQFSHFKIFSTL